MRRDVLLVILTACGGGHAKPDAASDAPPDGPTPGEIEAALFPAQQNLDVDLLFMLDDSSGMEEKLDRFRAAFPAFVDELTLNAGVLPNLHIGIVTPDLGVSGADGTLGSDVGGTSGGCVGSGDAAALHASSDVTSMYLSDIAGSGGLRQTNFPGTLADTFMRSTDLGGAGCGFEQSIEATKRVLATNPAGFLRPQASLAIIYLTDEDDCSVEHPGFFDPDTTVLGPLQSFRCTHFGVTCDVGGTTPDELNMPGAKSGCHSNDSGTYLTSVADYASFFGALKTDPRNVMLAAIAAPVSPFGIELRNGLSSLAHSCTYQTSDGTMAAGDPGVRLEQLVSGFRHRVYSSVCDPDYTLASANIARQIASMTGSACLVRALTPTATCHVFDERADGTRTEIPACSAGTTPCFTLDKDAATCPDLQHLRANVHRDAAPPSDMMVSVRCTLGAS